MGGVQSMTLLPKSVVLDGSMRQETKAQSTPVIATHPAGYGRSDSDT